MQYLSEATVREIMDLSLAQAAAAASEGKTTDQMWDSIIGGPSPEEKALQDSLDKLNQFQALDLVAMMYAGREMVQAETYTDEAKEKFVDVYNHNLVIYKNHGKDALIRRCEDKAPVLHRYLKAALVHSRY